MPDIGFGDMLFILLILGVIHGIMYSVTRARQRKRERENQSQEADGTSA